MRGLEGSERRVTAGDSSGRAPFGRPGGRMGGVTPRGLVLSLSSGAGELMIMRETSFSLHKYFCTSYAFVVFFRLFRMGNLLNSNTCRFEFTFSGCDILVFFVQQMTRSSLSATPFLFSSAQSRERERQLAQTRPRLCSVDGWILAETNFHRVA